MTRWDDGSGEALFVGGLFTCGGCTNASNIAKWNDSVWSPLGSGVSSWVYALTTFDGGSGDALYAGGAFAAAGGVAVNGIAAWDGRSWSPLGTGLGGPSPYVLCLTAFDDGGGEALYVGGTLTAAGGVSANRIARWDGSGWDPLGAGMDDRVYALTVFDDGTGEALYAGGRFTRAGCVADARHIAKWDGVTWSPLGTGTSNTVYALTVFDDGTGDALYAGGGFTNYGGRFFNGVAKWDGMAWSALGPGLAGAVYALTVFDDGTGEALYAGGAFTTAGEVTANRIARWDGSAWSRLGGGMKGKGTVRTLTVCDDCRGQGLFAGGEITTAYVARWGCIRGSGDCDGDGVLDPDDFATFKDCFTGPEVPAGPECDCADLDGDEDVDVVDFAAFQAAFTGAR